MNQDLDGGLVWPQYFFVNLQTKILFEVRILISLGTPLVPLPPF